MASTSITQHVAASPEAVWAHVGSFGDMHRWHPMVPGCTLQEDGLTRVIDAGGMRVVEVMDPDASGPSWVEYTVAENPLPVTDYRARIEVKAEAGGSQLAYTAQFTPVGVSEEEAAAMLTGFFGMGFQAVAAHFAG